MYAGLQNGLDNVYVAPFFNTTSRIRRDLLSRCDRRTARSGRRPESKTPSYLMTFAEVVVHPGRGRGARNRRAKTGARRAYYDAGVRASILQWGGTNAEADAYLARPGVAYVAGATGLRQIGLQKWIALFLAGLRSVERLAANGKSGVDQDGAESVSGGATDTAPDSVLEQRAVGERGQPGGSSRSAGA